MARQEATEVEHNRIELVQCRARHRTDRRWKEFLGLQGRKGVGTDGIAPLACTCPHPTLSRTNLVTNPPTVTPRDSDKSSCGTGTIA
ncbi:hypothetical protein Pmani_037750 [Petrolisthes manimaculis]|uniref:Uncharacterized protein n=1 Tax=Petrolisthes manimaculis TaxID=1843537 RepID=A0AAE1NH30_9EUCA|nr:hypothetical protein Pmani_037750 [Petrolisthes manimaculis]